MDGNAKYDAAQQCNQGITALRPEPAPAGREAIGARPGDRRPVFEDAVCELCGQPPTEPVLTGLYDIAWKKPGKFDLLRCKHCDLILTSPRPVPAAMPIYYEDWYGYKTPDEVLKEQRDSLPNRFIKHMRLDVLEKTGWLQRGAKLLDVGAGFGVQLEYFIQERGVVGTSLDFDPKTAEHSVVKGIANVRTGDLLDAGFAAKSFDVITMYETLEHVYHPKATLDEAYRILKPGGRLVVEVPDFGSPLRKLFGRFWFALMVPAHLHHFTKRSLRDVVTAAGFEPIRQTAMFVPFETTASLLLAYCHWSGASIYDVSRLSRLVKQRARHLPFFLCLALCTFLVDLPLQAMLATLRKTGAQTLIAVKP
ncbi:MAG: class I SAM-dependent methyltransferase [Planctomycetota bacterium]